MRHPQVITILVLCFILLFTGCITIYRDGQAKTNDPIIGEWKMERTDISPVLPVPELLLNQVIDNESTWKFSRRSNVLSLRFDGRDSWYKTPPGLNVQKKPASISEIMGKAPYVFSGGGSVKLNDMIANMLSEISGRRMEQISFDFNDEIQIHMISPAQIKATITVNAAGQYYGDTENSQDTMKLKTIQQTTVIIYNGYKK